MEGTALTVLSFGGGQDSTAMIYKYVYDAEFRAKHCPGRFLVIMSDTGDEHPHTYDHVKKMRTFCEEHGIEMIFITNDMGFHPNTWQDLRSHYEDKTAIGSKRYPKQCTDNLKLKPIYNCLGAWIEKNYGFRSHRKKEYREFKDAHGTIRMLIGFAKGEEKRMAKTRDMDPKWRQYAVQIAYPLIEERMDRQDCQDYIRNQGGIVPYPSNCILCPFMSKQELLWMYRNMPNDYHEWVRLEKNKMDRFKDELEPSKNLGVWGPKPLPVILEETLEEFGDMTDEELNSYKMNHGCVQSRY